MLDGFFHYELKQSKDRTLKFSAIGEKVRFGYCGDFITKEPLQIPYKDLYALEASDWFFPDNLFQFEDFFGMKLSINKQIYDAELKRAQRSKKHDADELEENNSSF